MAPRFKPPKFRERNAARALFGTGLSDLAIARQLKVSPRSVGRWRRSWQDGTDPWPTRSSFGVIAETARRQLDR